MTKHPRSDEEHAAIDAALSKALAVADDAREQRRQCEAEFLRPRFRRELVAEVLGVGNSTLANWQARSGLDLDADTGRTGTAWRMYSARDVVRLGVVVMLPGLGFPVHLTGGVVTQIEAVFPILASNSLLAANIPVTFAVLADGTVHGPEIGETVPLEGVDAASFVTLRMDRIVRAVLDPLGWSILDGDRPSALVTDRARETFIVASEVLGLLADRQSRLANLPAGSAEREPLAAEVGRLRAMLVTIEQKTDAIGFPAVAQAFRDAMDLTPSLADADRARAEELARDVANVDRGRRAADRGIADVF